jgi:hypothetical protein
MWECMHVMLQVAVATPVALSHVTPRGSCLEAMNFSQGSAVDVMQNGAVRRTAGSCSAPQPQLPCMHEGGSGHAVCVAHFLALPDTPRVHLRNAMSMCSQDRYRPCFMCRVWLTRGCLTSSAPPCVRLAGPTCSLLQHALISCGRGLLPVLALLRQLKRCQKFSWTGRVRLSLVKH